MDPVLKSYASVCVLVGDFGMWLRFFSRLSIRQLIFSLNCLVPGCVCVCVFEVCVVLSSGLRSREPQLKRLKPAPTLSCRISTRTIVPVLPPLLPRTVTALIHFASLFPLYICFAGIFIQSQQLSVERRTGRPSRTANSIRRGAGGPSSSTGFRGPPGGSRGRSDGFQFSWGRLA